MGIALLVSILLPSLTAKPLPAKEGAASEAEPAATGLATTGDFTKIIAELPAGKADSGKASVHQSGLFGLPQFGSGQSAGWANIGRLFTTAATREPGVGAKEYLYESIVDPNKFVV
ncbi:MAG: hypothetical protein V9F04_16730 [Dermatophilaceae bacterium]